jgi:hypothetical protein
MLFVHVPVGTPLLLAGRQLAEHIANMSGAGKYPLVPVTAFVVGLSGGVSQPLEL